MVKDYDSHSRDLENDSPSGPPRVAPGKRTRTQMLMRKETSTGETTGWGSGSLIETANRGGGVPLASTTRATLESASGADLSNVRVHTGSGAAEAASSVGAKAFTVGSDIYFGKGNYDAGGDELLAHEVAHTIQQSCRAPTMQTKLESTTPGDAYEREADAFASAIMSGSAAPTISKGPTQLARKEDAAKDDATTKAEPQLDGETQTVSDGNGPGKVVWREGRGLTLSNFGRNSPDPKPEHIAAIGELRDKLQTAWTNGDWSLDDDGQFNFESWAKLVKHVWGYTSPEGDATNNGELSAARADAVASELGDRRFYKVGGGGIASSSTDPATWPAMRKVEIRTEPWEIDMQEDEEESFVAVDYHERIAKWVPRVSNDTSSVYLQHLLRKLTKGGAIVRGLDDYLSHNAVGMLDVGEPLSSDMIDGKASSAADALAYALERPTYEDFKASVEHLDRAILDGLDRASKKNSLRATDDGPASAIADWIGVRINNPAHIYSAYGGLWQRWSQ